jgi:phosphoribulokinase
VYTELYIKHFYTLEEDNLSKGTRRGQPFKRYKKRTTFQKVQEEDNLSRCTRRGQPFKRYKKRTTFQKVQEEDNLSKGTAFSFFKCITKWCWEAYVIHICI